MPISSSIYRNSANVVSILGVLPLCLLLRPGGGELLPALIVFNNFMDDLDGILARVLRIRSRFGALLDNVCDAVAHSLIVLVVGLLYGDFVLLLAALAVVGILIRIVRRVDDLDRPSRGSPTNELMRHLFLILLLEQVYQVELAWAAGALMVLNTVSMLVPFRLPNLIRSRTTTTSGVLLVNVALVVAWRLPPALPIVAILFLGAYLWCLGVETYRWRFSQARAE